MQAIGRIRTIAVNEDDGGEFLVQRTFQSQGETIYVLSTPYQRHGNEIEYCMVVGFLVEEFIQFDQPIEIEEA